MSFKTTRLLAALVLASLLGGRASAALLFESGFTSDDGGMTVDSDSVEGPWHYNGGAGTWSTDGSANIGVPTYSGLRSPTVVVGQSGPVDLYFSHRHSFEYDGIRWDGGQVRVSVDGGPYTTVPAASFTTNGYVGVIEGNNAITGQMAYNGDSADYAIGSFINSHASLGSYPLGTALSVEFFGAWDEFAQGQLPNWEVTDMRMFDSAVPEPSSIVLVIAGAAAGLIAVRRRAAK